MAIPGSQDSAGWPGRFPPAREHGRTDHRRWATTVRRGLIVRFWEGVLHQHAVGLAPQMPKRPRFGLGEGKEVFQRSRPGQKMEMITPAPALGPLEGYH